VGPLLARNHDSATGRSVGNECLKDFHVSPYLIHLVPAPTTETSVATVAALPRTETTIWALMFFMTHLQTFADFFS
jgi:hypothetical protein